MPALPPMKHSKAVIVCASLVLAANAAGGSSEAEACTIGYAPPAAAYPLDGETVVAFTTGTGPTASAPPEPPLLAFRIESFDPNNPQDQWHPCWQPTAQARVFLATFAGEIPPNTVGYRLYRTLDGEAEMLSQTAASWPIGGPLAEAAREGEYPQLFFTMYDMLDVNYEYEVRAVSPTDVETAFTGTAPREVPAAKAPEEGAVVARRRVAALAIGCSCLGLRG